MDLNSLKDTVSNLTLYDIKAGVRKVQNGRSSCPVEDERIMTFQTDICNAAVMNYTEMESKVRDTAP